MTRISALAAALALAAAPLAAQPRLQLISHAYDNPNAAINAYYPELSADGQWVSFSSTASGFVAPGVDGFFGADVFVYDVFCRRTEIASLTWDGKAPNNSSGGSVGRSSISGDGRYVAFASRASNLVYGDNDSNGHTDVFLLDRHRAVGDPQRIRRVSAARAAGSDGPSDEPSISADGRYLAFQSAANNLVANDNSGTNVFVYDVQADSLALVSRDRDGKPAEGQYPRIDAQGRRLAFRSGALNLIAEDIVWSTTPHVYLRDLGTGSNQLVDRRSDGQIPTQGATDVDALSGDGRYVSFRSSAPNLTGSASPLTPQIFVRDTVAGTLEMITINPGNAPTPYQSRWSALDHDGRHVAFSSPSQGPWSPAGLYRRDRSNGATELLSPGHQDGSPQDSSYASISADGLRTAFVSGYGRLIPGVNAPAIFLADLRSSVPPRYCPR